MTDFAFYFCSLTRRPDTRHYIHNSLVTALWSPQQRRSPRRPPDVMSADGAGTDSEDGWEPRGARASRVAPATAAALAASAASQPCAPPSAAPASDPRAPEPKQPKQEVDGAGAPEEPPPPSAAALELTRRVCSAASTHGGALLSAGERAALRGLQHAPPRAQSLFWRLVSRAWPGRWVRLDRLRAAEDGGGGKEAAVAGCHAAGLAHRALPVPERERTAPGEAGTGPHGRCHEVEQQQQQQQQQPPPAMRELLAMLGKKELHEVADEVRGTRKRTRYPSLSLAQIHSVLSADHTCVIHRSSPLLRCAPRWARRSARATRKTGWWTRWRRTPRSAPPSTPGARPHPMRRCVQPRCGAQGRS